MSKINVLINGSTGYIGIQLVKLLLKHKYIKIKYLCGSSSVGKNISFFDKTLKNKNLPKITKFNKKMLNDVLVVFSALPNGEAQKISKFLLKKNTLIDLSADFRLIKAKDYFKWYKIKHSAIKNIKKSIYALPEIKKGKVKKYKIISCPGCYPTSILLPLIPLIKKGLIKNKNIIIDSKSGYSGAGRKVHKKYANKNLYESLSVYGIPIHRHNSEIQQEFDLISNKKIDFIFTPHLSPMFRGILTTIYAEVNNNQNVKKITNELKKFYTNEHFVRILKPNTLLSTNDVMNTNYCYISVCKSKSKNKIIILSAIDNLIKGGAGQAVQNLNIINNFKLNTGLK
tara:strand:- start:3366 stop:4388 length:1023 start_codon:yes stop_codon:yes gene_type:complete